MNLAKLQETKSTIRFSAKLFRTKASDKTGSWTLPLPKNASAKLPPRGMTMVEGTINGFPFRAALEPNGKGSHWLSALFNKYDNVLFAVFALSLLCLLWEGTNLPRKSPYKIVLTKQEREELERRANKYTLPYFIVARAKMMLLAEQGLANDEIANSLSTRREIVSRWRKRFFEKRLGGLEDFPRPVRPRVFPPRAGRAR